MALSGVGELAAAVGLVVAIWSAGVVYIKAADYWMQTRSDKVAGFSRAALPAGRAGSDRLG
jgi:hypothetical protein